MYNNDKYRSNYQGPFAWRPDKVDHGIWGSTETHRRVVGPDVRVEKDWYGNVTKVERSWF
jgi:hypothetical protein